MLITNSEFLRTEIMDVLRAFGAEEENFTHYFSCAGGKFYNSIEYNGVFYDFEEEYGGGRNCFQTPCKKVVQARLL